MNPLQGQPQHLPAPRHAGIAPAKVDERKQIEQAAVKFEGMFVAHLLGEMRKINEAFAPQSAGADAGLLDHAYRLMADDIAAQHAFGVADTIVAQMAPRHALPGIHPNPHGPQA